MKTYIDKIECGRTLNLLIMNQIFAYDRAKESYPQYDVTPVAKGIIEGIQIAMNHIACMQAIEAVPVVHGEWIKEKCNHKPCRIKNPEKWVIYKCSVCGYSNGRKISNYCPSCGAKMDEGKE